MNQCTTDHPRPQSENNGRIPRNLKPRPADGYTNEKHGAGEDLFPSADPTTNGTSGRIERNSNPRKKDKAAVAVPIQDAEEPEALDADAPADACQDADCDTDGMPEDGNESFLLGDRPAMNTAPGSCNDTWHRSKAIQLISCKGSEDMPGNWGLMVPRWVRAYFGNPEKAMLFAAILYWFGRTKYKKPRMRRKDREGRCVLEKTYAQLANEAGLANERRVGCLLKKFRDEHHLLDYYPVGIGRGKKTQICPNPEGIELAYLAGRSRLDEQEKK
ncbi:MAG: hypothetical protein WCJ35_02375 [Planctomycetota bacterium]